jgi:predicted CoA-binding protein
VFKDLLEGGYHVIAINPNEKTILDQKVFPNISACSEKIDVVIFVVPPKVTESVLHEVVENKISHVRMQP